MRPDLWSSADVLERDVVPPVPGVYGWYFDRVPPGVPEQDCHRVAGTTLLYVGISPGRPGSRQDLRKRLRYHYSGNFGGSTLRRTLACLLQRELRLRFRRAGSGRSIRIVPEGEQRLSRWMAEHARVAWAPCIRPWEVEHDLLRAFCLPLNLQGNRHHSFYAILKRLRARTVSSVLTL